MHYVYVRATRGFLLSTEVRYVSEILPDQARLEVNIRKKLSHDLQSAICPG